MIRKAHIRYSLEGSRLNFKQVNGIVLSEGCTSPELETSNPEKFEEVSKGFQLDLSKEQNDYYSQAFASMAEPGFDPNESPIDDMINRFRYSRRDFAVLHCEAPPGEVCFETSVQAVTFESPLTPWRCVLHRETIPEDGDKGLNASQRVPDSFTPGSDSLEEIVWKPASKLPMVSDSQSS